VDADPGLTEDRRLILMAAWMLVLANWVGQDYLAPQGFNFVLYLWFIALLAYYFGRPVPAMEPLRRRFERILGEPMPGPQVGADAHPPAAQAGMLLVVAAIAATSVASHQLTPFAMVGASLALVLIGARAAIDAHPRVRHGGVGVAFAGYTFSPATSDRSCPTSATRRAQRDPASSSGCGSDGHLFVVLERIVFSVAFWGLAALGALRRLRAGHWDPRGDCARGVHSGPSSWQSYGGDRPGCSCSRCHR
jgi:hypothetical protein